MNWYVSHISYTSSIGCIVLYSGQGKFHSSTSDTLNFVVGQANITVENLRNFSDDLSAAKKTGVDQVFLPGNVQGQIDDIVNKVNSSANSLDRRAQDNSEKIKDLLDLVYGYSFLVWVCFSSSLFHIYSIKISLVLYCRRLILIVVAAVMLFLTFLGFCKHLCILYTKNWFFFEFYFVSDADGHVLGYVLQYFLYLGCNSWFICKFNTSLLLLLMLFISVTLFNGNIQTFLIDLMVANLCSLVLVGWILVAGTFILCGVFLVLHK